MATRTLDPEATRGAILEAAETLFVDKGFSAVSMSDIAREAGVTKSLIHHHFGSKDDLWKATKTRLMAEYFEAQAQMLENYGTIELLRDSIVAYFRFLQRNPRVMRMMAWLDIAGDPVMIEAGQRVSELGEARLREGQRDGVLRADVEPGFMIDMFIGLVQHWFRSRPPCSTESGSAEADDAYLQSLLTVFFEGVLTPTGRQEYAQLPVAGRSPFG